ncbi:MAG: hypothetical protein JWP04_3344 [Belnapia sp.]|nr:hypothetical protein [Belnapia sp.]
MLQQDRLGSFTPQMPDPAAGAAPVLAGFGPDWILLTDARIGTERIDFVLLHPALGVALLQVAPHWTAEAPGLLRQRLAEARFGAIFHGYLPVVHRMLRPGELPALPRRLTEAFAGQPPLDLPSGDAWMQVVRRALTGVAGAELDPASAALPKARRQRGMAAGLVLAATMAGVILLTRPWSAEVPEPLGILAVAIASADAAAAVQAPDSGTDAPSAEAWGGSPAMPAEPPPDAVPRLVEMPKVQEPEVQALSAEVRVAPVAEVPVAVVPLVEAPVAEVAPPVASPADSAPISLAAAATKPVLPSMAEPALTNPALTTPAVPLAHQTMLLRLGEARLALGDVSAARRFFERVAEAGSAAGAHALGETYDPDVLARLGAWGIRPDPAAAATWYRRAQELAAHGISASANLETVR